MKEIFVNIWDLYDAGEIVCITTNGHVKQNGEAVMGRGPARQAIQRWPSLARTLGGLIEQKGSMVQLIRPRLLSFPVKASGGVSDGTNVVGHVHHRYPKGYITPGWALKADLDIIRRSLDELARLSEEHGWERVYLPRPGCGAGELDWAQVRLLCRWYGDWLVVVDWPGREE